MIAPDEFRYGEIPREMIERNDFVSPRLLGIRYFEKPALGYQMTAVSIMALGENAFAVRLPSALGAGLAALMIYWLVRRVRKDEFTASLSAMIYLTFGMVYGIGVFAVLDSQTAGFVTGCTATYFMALESRDKKERWGFLSLSGIFCGLAFMTKGFLAFAVPGITALAYLLIRKRYREIFTTPFLVILFTVLTAGPWSLMIHLREPDFWNYFFFVEHWQRFVTAPSGQHKEPFWFLLPCLIGGAFPAAIFAGGGFLGLKRYWNEVKKDELFWFALCWLILPFLLFSASSGKLATYILPCYAPLALLFADGIQRYWRDGGQKAINWPLRVTGWILVLGAVGFSVAQIMALSGVVEGVFGAGESWKWIGAVVLAAGLGVALEIGWHRCPSKLALVFFLGLIPMLILGNGAYPNRYKPGKALEEQLLRYAEPISQARTLVVQPSVMHAVGWLFGRTDVILALTTGELEHSIQHYPEYDNRFWDSEEYLSRFREHADDLVLVTRRQNKNYVDQNLQPVEEYSENRLWVVRYKKEAEE